jgi:short-subunit dehydrogenase
VRVHRRAVIVTGASSGIGKATARLLADKGARVWAVGRSEARLQRLGGEHPGITPFRADLTVEADRAALVEAVGTVDVLVNNAGIGWIGRVAEMPADEVRALFEVNVLGLIDLTQRVTAGMCERRFGHVVNVASVASYAAVPPLTVYASTKFAVQGFTDGLRRELAFSGVTVGTVNPGPIATEFFDRALDREPGDHEARAGPGTGWVARAILRSIELRRVPGYQAIAVPRLFGIARLASVPGVTRLVDGAALVGRRSPRYLRARD